MGVAHGANPTLVGRTLGAGYQPRDRLPAGGSWRLRSYGEGMIQSQPGAQRSDPMQSASIHTAAQPSLGWAILACLLPWAMAVLVAMMACPELSHRRAQT